MPEQSLIFNVYLGIHLRNGSMRFILNKSRYKKGKNILEHMTYHTLGMILFSYSHVLLVRLVTTVVEEVIVMVAG